jgi:hypothetical protein
MQLELSSADQAVLERIIERALSDMRVEVRRTTTPKYHDDLRADEERVKGILARIKERSRRDQRRRPAPPAPS